MEYKKTDFLKFKKEELIEQLIAKSKDYDRLVDGKDSAIAKAKQDFETSLELEKGKYILLETEKNEEIAKVKNNLNKKYDAENVRCGQITDEKDQEIFELKEKHKTELEQAKANLENQFSSKEKEYEGAIENLEKRFKFICLKYDEVSGMLESYNSSINEITKQTASNYNYSLQHLWDVQYQDFLKNGGNKWVITM